MNDPSRHPLPAPNLTEVRARQRADLLDVVSYEIDLDVTDGAGRPGTDTFRSTTTVRFTSRQPGASTWIDLLATRVPAATLNGTPVDLDTYRPADGLPLVDLRADNELVVVADCQFLNTGAGLHRFVDPVDEAVYLFTQFELADAKRVFACFDQPDLKARVRLTVTAPADWTVVSNSPVSGRGPGAGGATRTAFAETPPLPTYLVALVAGPYFEATAEYSDGQHTVPLGLYCRRSLGHHLDTDRLFDETRRAMAFFLRAFDTPYPFDKYDVCFVPEFNGGAMENAACTTISERFVFRSRATSGNYERRAEHLAHELAHMWFGDLVTMRWWDDLWLNESFATWAGLHALPAVGYPDAWAGFAVNEKGWACQQDQLPSTHPIAGRIDDLHAVEVNFDGITYAKGASVLKQLIAQLGLDTFLAGMRTYFRRHAWGNATLADLLAVLAETAGRDLSGFSAQWLESAGLTVLSADFSLDDDDRFTRFQVRQSTAQPGVGGLRDHRIAIGVYDEEPGTGALRRTHRVEVDVAGERTEVPALAGVDRGALVLLNDDDLSYATVRLDPGSMATVRSGIARIAAPLPRAVCWSAAWEMTRSAELRARDFMELVLSGVPGETELIVLQRLLWEAGTALSLYADPAWEMTGWQRISDRLVDLARDAEPGSDRQLAFVRSFAGSVLGPGHCDVLRGWLDASDPLPGLVVDVDLRWHLLHALVAHGHAGRAEIDAERDRDPTDTGRRAAEQAAALTPTEAVKEQTWQRLMTDASLSNGTSEALVAGFWHPAQNGLLRPYADRYFTDIHQVWRRRSSEAAQFVVRGLSPEWAADPELLRAADECLAADQPTGLRRLLAEGRANLVRSLAAREFDRDSAPARPLTART